MIGIFDGVIRTATRRNQWDVPAGWKTSTRPVSNTPDRRAIASERARLRRTLSKQSSL